MSNRGHEKNVIIIGAGPSGCSAAISAFNEGHEVTVIESRTRSSIIECEKTSFEAFQNLTSSGDAVKFLSNMGIDIKPEYPYIGACVIGPSERVVNIRMNRLHGYFIRRNGKRSLDHQLIEMVEDLEIDIRYGTRLIEAEERGVIKYQDKNGIDITEGRIIIGADGISSVTGRNISPALRKDDVAVGMGIHFGGEHGFEPGIARCYLGSHLCPGEYAYVLPTEDEVSVVTTMRPHLMRRDLSTKDHLDRFLSIPEIEKGLEGTKKVSNINGAVPVTCGGPLGRGKILLIGEAARLTDPVMGFGMVNAITSGVEAGRSISKKDPLVHYSDIISATLIPDMTRRSRARLKLMDRIDDDSLDKMIDIISEILEHSSPEDIMEETKRRRSMASTIPHLVRCGGLKVAMRYFIPFLYSNFSSKDKVGIKTRNSTEGGMENASV